MKYEVLIPTEEWHAITNEEAFSFNEYRGFRWLQKLCLWVLRKLGCQYSYKYRSVKTVRVDLEKLHELILQQSHAVRRVLGWKCKYLIIGEELALKLSIEADDMFWFNVPNESRRFAGMIVIVVPWFEGFLCLPELK